MKLGFIVNPIAGMGGKVGLKGTDGKEILEKARLLGAKAESSTKAEKALEILSPLAKDLEVITCPGDMGEKIAKRLGFKTLVLGKESQNTSPEDTERAAKKMLDMGINLLLFAGGDGTARNIYNSVADRLPVIGIPAGVKIHSAVYANHPRSAGELALKYLKGDIKNLQESEVMDIDEEAFRQGYVTAKLYGYMQLPFERQLVQSLKSARPQAEDSAQAGVADKIVAEMEEDYIYIIGSGTSTRPIMEKLGLANTLLGIDLVKNKNLIAADANESTILKHIENERSKIVVTVIGGQGYIFGRGNQQLSSQVIKKVGIDNIRIIATKSKLISLGGRPLLVDSGDDETNKLFNRYMKVAIGYNEEMVYPVKGL